MKGLDGEWYASFWRGGKGRACGGGNGKIKEKIIKIAALSISFVFPQGKHAPHTHTHTFLSLPHFCLPSYASPPPPFSQATQLGLDFAPAGLQIGNVILNIINRPCRPLVDALLELLDFFIESLEGAFEFFDGQLFLFVGFCGERGGLGE